MSNKYELLKNLKQQIEQEDMSKWLISKQLCHKVSEFTNAFNNYITPNSKTANNLDSKIMIVLQDWGSYNDLIKNGKINIQEKSLKLGYNPNLKANKILHNLLYTYFKNHLNLDSNYNLNDDHDLSQLFSKIYITNIFPFIKPGKMSAYIPDKLVKKARKEFIEKEIEIINPKLVICCGRLPFIGLSDEKVDFGGYIIKDERVYYKQYHPSSRIKNKIKHSQWQKMHQDFIKMNK